MANNENLNGHGFHERTAREQREIAIAGGKASGEARRRKAAMRDTMNRLLTMKVEVEGLSDILRADGGESTYEEIITMAMIEKAMRGDVKAFMAIKDVLGQTSKSETDLEEQKIRMEQLKADTERMRRETSPEEDDGVEVVNDAPKETGQDIGDSNTEIPTDF
ncbi:hypothetical protein [Enterocloster bolteae]|uniref:hypothetical protein n=1 Tax=Enterocloster bolteae TaxID=208479 RepID=UPI002A827E13|nr:hypothetical protein [Enterocloster bolteae]